jgi:hypothetical protein
MKSDWKSWKSEHPSVEFRLQETTTSLTTGQPSQRILVIRALSQGETKSFVSDDRFLASGRSISGRDSSDAF